MKQNLPMWWYLNHTKLHRAPHTLSTGPVIPFSLATRQKSEEAPQLWARSDADSTD